MGIIYCCTNNINQKKYIGQTKRTLKERQVEHFRCINDGLVFHNALIKYGKDNFSWEILKECSNEELNDWEIFYIDYYDTYWKHNNGYNMTLGGQGFTCTKPVRVYKIVNNKKEFVQDFSSENEAADFLYQLTGYFITNDIISKICLGKKHYNNWHNYTFRFIDENNNDIQIEYKGRYNKVNKAPKSIKVIYQNSDKEQIFRSINAAAKELRISRDTIRKKINTDQFFKGMQFIEI